MKRLSHHRSYFVMMLLSAAMLCGCAAGNAAGLTTSGQEAEVPTEASRVATPLAEIEPRVARPTAANAISPLSGRAQRQVDAAERLIAQQRYTEASLKLERALRYEPDHPILHRALALMHWEAGATTRARHHATVARDANPDDSTVHYILGRCALQTGDHIASRTSFRTALLCSDFGKNMKVTTLCHYYLAEALAGEGYLEAALQQYEAAGDENPHGATDPTVSSVITSAALARSRILESLERYSASADALGKVAAASPADVALQARYARVLRDAGRLDEALAVAEAIASEDEDTIDLLFSIHEAAGQPDRMVDDLRRRLAVHPDRARLAIRLADVLQRLDRNADAARSLQSFHDTHKDAVAIILPLMTTWFELGEAHSALKVCAAGIRHHPGLASELASRFVTLTTQGEQAEKLMADAPSEDAPESLYLLARLAHSVGEDRQAQAWLERANEIAPMLLPVRIALAERYIDTFRYEDAMRIAARAQADRAEDTQLETLLGKIHARLDETEPSTRHFKAAIQLDKTNAVAMLALCALHEQEGNRLQAQRHLRVLLDQHPDLAIARERLILLYLREGQADEAAQQLAALQEHSPSSAVTARCEGIFAYAHSGDAESYRAALRASGDEVTADARTWIDIADSYNDMEQAAAKEAYQHALSLDRQSEQALLGLIKANQRLLNFEEAISDLEALLPRRPNRHRWRRKLVWLHWVVQDYEEAITLARDAATKRNLEPDTLTKYRLMLADSLRYAGRGEEALAMHQAWAEADAGNSDWLIAWANACAQQDKTTKAASLYEAALDLDPEKESLWAPLVDALVAAGRHDRAMQYAIDRLDQDPESDASLSLMLTVLAETNRVDEAVELVRNKLLHTQDRERFQDIMIGLFSLSSQHDDGMAWTESLIDRVGELIDAGDDRSRLPATADRSPDQRSRLPDDPTSLPRLFARLVELRTSLARQMIDASAYGDARDRIASWLDAMLTPRSRQDNWLREWLSSAQQRYTRARFEWLLLMGRCLQELGEQDEAAEALERALLLQLTHVGLNNDVAYGWINRGVNLDRAEPMIRYALSSSPRQSAYLDTYGWLLYKKGAFAEAKRWLTRAAGTSGEGDPVIHDHLGDACWQLERREEAIEHWSTAVTKLNDRADQTLDSDDERRVRDRTPSKIIDARAGRSPAVAPLGDIAKPANGDS